MRRRPGRFGGRKLEITLVKTRKGNLHSSRLKDRKKRWRQRDDDRHDEDPSDVQSGVAVRSLFF